MTHSFLRESKLYIEYGGNKDRIYTAPAITFNQTFAQDSYSVKTLHDQSKMFEGSTINKANPASFSFDVPLTVERDERHIVTLLSDTTNGQFTSFNIYIVTGSSTFKLEDAVITAGEFDINPQRQFTVRVQGDATKLERVGDESYNLGTIQSESSTRTPLLVYPVDSLDGSDVTNIISTTLSIRNEINWTPYSTVHAGISVTDADDIMRPSNYIIDKRNVSGAFRQYQLDSNVTKFDDFSTSSNLIIKAIKVGESASATPFFQIQLNPAAYTARIETDEIYSQSYDYRSLDNTNSVSTQITQYI